MNEHLLTVDEIARSLRVTEVTVRRWIARGWLPAIKVGGAVRIREEDLARFVTTPGTPAGGWGSEKQ